MKNIIVIFTILCNSLLITHYSFSQAPDIEWQNNIGGSGDDIPECISSTTDGGYILASRSKSGISGDKTELNWGWNDYWVIKLNAAGEIEWQNSIGGTREDELYSVEQTTDGGYFLAGYSYSDLNGEKTENSEGHDIWVIKLSSTGTIVWQNTIGGNRTDRVFDAQQTEDGGYILGASSNSDATGDKTLPVHGIVLGSYPYAYEDFWLVKLNAAGNIQWQKVIGGDEKDQLQSIQQTLDGGYIMGGISLSDISGDKTQDAYDGGYYGNDYWIVKVDNGGNIQWEKTLGGNGDDYLNSIKQVADGGYIIGGYSDSEVGGDKTGYDGIDDYWVIKLDNTGNIVWQNTLGGSADDHLHSLEITSDGGFILAGFSSSNISGDKTEVSVGEADYWIIKLNFSGNIVWQKTIGGENDDLLRSIIPTEDGGFIIGGDSESDATGDKTENRVVNYGYDLWVIKLESDCVFLYELCNGLDDNCNGLIDDGLIELCNGLDDDCNGLIDDGLSESISIYAAGPITFCKGGEVLLTGSYTGETVQWKKNGANIAGATSSSFTVTTKGTYTCETTSACDTELSSGIFVNVLKSPLATITAGGATTFCAGGSVILSANSGVGLSYQWFKNGNTITGATSINYSATATGNYKCRVTKTATGCFKNSTVIEVTVPCKEGEELLSNSNFTIFPNPNTGTFNLIYNFPTGAISPLEGGPRGVMTIIEIFNSLGQQIHSQQINSTDGNINETISLNNLSSGIYFVRLDNGTVYSQEKLIIE